MRSYVVHLEPTPALLSTALLDDDLDDLACTRLVYTRRMAFLIIYDETRSGGDGASRGYAAGIRKPSGEPKASGLGAYAAATRLTMYHLLLYKVTRVPAPLSR